MSGLSQKLAKRGKAMVRLDELKAQNPIVDVVERYGVALQPSGKNRRYRQILAKAQKWDLAELVPGPWRRFAWMMSSPRCSGSYAST